MSTSAPRRRPSPAVYRRRRLAVLLLLLVVVGIVWLLIAQPWRGDSTAASSPTPTVSSAPSATPSVSTSAGPDTAEDAEAAASASPGDVPPECTPGDVAVEAVTDQTSYAAGQFPQFSIRLTNSGGDCTMNVGTTTQSFIVTSGTETYWRSTDCQVEPSDMVVTIPAGKTVTSATPVTWDRTRSSVDSCEVARADAPAAGASYHLAVAIGGITSATTAQFILN